MQRQNLENEKLKTEKKSLKEDLQKTQVRFFEVTSVIKALVSPNKSCALFFRFLIIVLKWNTGFLMQVNVSVPP